MYDPQTTFTIAAASLAGLSIASYAGLKGWRGWLDLKRLEIEHSGLLPGEIAPPSTGSRIEVADLKERIRKLEAIAAGIEI